MRGAFAIQLPLGADSRIAVDVIFGFASSEEEGTMD